MPSEEVFWASLVARTAGPSPDPWRLVNAEILEAVAMLQAVSRASDPKNAGRLQSEAADKLQGAAQKINAHQTVAVSQ